MCFSILRGEGYLTGISSGGPRIFPKGVSQLPNWNYYRPQRSWAKVMFLQASVILSTGGCLPQCMLGCQTPPREQTPPQTRPPQTRHTLPNQAHHSPRPGTLPREQTPPQTRHPPGSRHPPKSRHPPEEQIPPREQTPLPPDQAPPGSRPPAPEADTSIRSMSGRYVSYWKHSYFTNLLQKTA